MGTLSKYAREPATHNLMRAVYISFFLLSAPVYPANVIPTADDINRIAEKATLTVDTFMKQSFELRMKYEYSGKFLNKDDRNNLYRLAKDASDCLYGIAEEQKGLKQKIEDYKGDDWEDKYGSTGLWRKLAADLYTTNLWKFETDFYLAITTQQPQKNIILHKILREVDWLSQAYKQFGPQLVNGKVLSLLAQTEPAYRIPAIKELDAFKIYSDISSPIQAAIEKIKLVGSAEPNELEALVRCLEQNRHSGDLELILPLMFLQRKYDPVGFEKAVQTFPETEDFLGSLILSDISSRSAEHEDLEQLSVFEAELAALSAWKNETKDYKMPLEHLAKTKKFQTPLILYVTGAATAESSPAEAVSLLIQASRLQQLQRSGRLDVEVERIAEQAAKLAYNLFAKDALYCELALEAFENYFALAGKKFDEELEYLRTVALSGCGHVEKSKSLLEKIADRPAGAWRNRAKLDLIVQQLRQSQTGNQSRQNELLEQLRDFILNCHGQDKKSNDLRMEAINIYCQLLLESKDKLSSQKVLNILDEAENTPGVQLDLFKSKALQKLGILDKSIHHMFLAIRDDSGSLAGQVNELLSEVIDTIDQLQSQADDFDKMMQDCKKLAEFSYKVREDRKSALYLAEVSVFEAGEEKSKLSAVEKLLSSIPQNSNTEDADLLRCRARLLTGQGEFEKAGVSWAKICKIRISEAASESQRSWKWWRAKFYELYCCTKITRADKREILHTIEVLQNSFSDIPPLWAEKLSLLKQDIK